MEKRPKLRRKQKIHQEISVTESDFQFGITRIAVSQICQSLIGFKGSQLSAINTLTVITTNYLQTLAKTVVSFAAAAGRTEPNVFDVVNALFDLSASTQGLSCGSSLSSSSVSHGNSKRDCLLLGSCGGVLEGIMGFVSSTDEIPFAKPIPRQEEEEEKMVPFTRVFEKRPSNDQSKLCLHIPQWLPQFPVIIINDNNNNKNGRIEGQKLWEDSDAVVETLVDSCNESGNGGSGGGGGGGVGELPMERERVRFKIGGGGGGDSNKGGVKVRNGLCRGGKRVCWCGDNENDHEIVCENHDKFSNAFMKI